MANTTDTKSNIDFNAMLKKFMPYSMLSDEIIKREYFLSKVNKKDNWKGGEIQVPFMGARASSQKFGGLTASNKINQDKPVLGTISNYKELWGSMVFNDHDLLRHDNLEQSFLKILPQTLENFISSMKTTVSQNLMNGSHLVEIVFGGANEDLNIGVVQVKQPERLLVNQFVHIGVVGTSRVPNGLYIVSIDMEKETVLLSETEGGVGVDLDTVAGNVTSVVADGDKLFIDGAIVAGKTFNSLKSQLLPASAGGNADHFGIAKSSYPFLQTYAKNGAAMTAATVLDFIFDAHNKARQIGKGNPNEAIMSYKNLAAVMKSIENGTGPGLAAQYQATDTKANVFGWTEIMVTGVKGSLKIVGVPDMDDDCIFILDWSTIDLFTNGMFQRRRSPEGKEFYEERSTDGFIYIVDVRFFGELVVNKPASNAVIYGIDFA